MNWRTLFRTESAAASTGAYEPLSAYLRARFANRSAMTFAEVESVLGFTLPAQARAERDWWSSADPLGHHSTHADGWMRADCVATVNLAAQTVVFERQTLPANRR